MTPSPPLCPCSAAALRRLVGSGGSGDSEPPSPPVRASGGSTGGGFGGLGGGGGGFGGFAKAGESTEGGFPALSTVFGDANKPVQLFGKSRDADDNGDEGGDDDATPESAPAETKPVITLQQQEVTSGEEDEECIFTTDGALYEFVTEDDKGSHVERARKGRVTAEPHQGRWSAYGHARER